MSDEARSVRTYTLSVILVIALAAAVRLIGLGHPMLGEGEASQALNAAVLTPDASAFWHPGNAQPPRSPAYEVMTAMLFHLFGTSDGLARLVPALAGIGLALCPLLLRRRLGLGRAVLASVLLGLSPTAITTSRLAGGSSLAALGLVLVVFNLLQEGSSRQPARLVFVAVGFAVAIASGGMGLHGLLGLVLGLLLGRILGRNPLGMLPGREVMKRPAVLGIAVLSFLAIITAFGMNWQGLVGFSHVLVHWLSGWLRPGEQSALAFLMMLPVYELLLTVFGGLGALLTWRREDPLERLMILWAAGGLLAGMIYVGRRPEMLLWAVVPLSILGASGIHVLLERIARRSRQMAFYALVAVLLVLSFSALLGALSYVNGYIPLLTGEVQGGAFLILGAGALMLVSVLVLFGMGWSWSLVLDAGGCALLAITLLLGLGSAWRLNYGRGEQTAGGLWFASAPTAQMELLEGSLIQASRVYAGADRALPILFRDPPDALLAWRLRAFASYEELAGEAGGTSPPAVLLRPSEQTPGLYAAYYGQGFAHQARRAWFGLLPSPFLRYWLTGKAPTVTEGWVMLLRADVAAFGEAPPAQLSPVETEPGEAE